MNPVQKMHDKIENLIIDALHLCQKTGKLNFEQIPPFVVEVPREKGHGDFASNVAMLLAKQARMAPRKIAETIVEAIDIEDGYIEKIEVAGAGFINVHLNNNWLYEIPTLVVKLGDLYE